jgi:hypothetical protein
VISNAAEGVEIAVASEHNVIADLEPIVKELGLGAELVSIPGDELTTDASRHPWGHANAWPLPLDPTKPRGGAPIGGLARGPDVTLKVHIECAPWVTVDKVRVVRARDGDLTKGDDERKVTLAPMKSGALGADVVLHTRVKADDAVFVVASGTQPMKPVLAGDDAEIVPWAMTGAIWVDADGDGVSLGRSKSRAPAPN